MVKKKKEIVYNFDEYEKFPKYPEGYLTYKEKRKKHFLEKKKKYWK